MERVSPEETRDFRLIGERKGTFRAAEWNSIVFREIGKKKRIFARPCEFFPLKIKTATTNERNVWKGRGGIKEKKGKKRWGWREKNKKKTG